MATESCKRKADNAPSMISEMTESKKARFILYLHNTPAIRDASLRLLMLSVKLYVLDHTLLKKDRTYSDNLAAHGLTGSSES